MTIAINEADFIVRQTNPLNAEPLPEKLIASYLTSQSLLYVRSHGPTPLLGPDHAVEVRGDVLTAVDLTLTDFRTRFSERRIVSAMQCAGNRRADLQPVRKTNGDPWEVGAIGNVEWAGVSLADVLHDAGIGERRDGFVAFTGADEVEVEGHRAPYGVSITLKRAMRGDVLIAWAAGGEPLTPPHGAPLRLVVPGYAGVRSAKWLTRIEVTDEPNSAPIQANDYKLFPPGEDGEAPDWNEGLTIEAMPVNSAICTPGDGEIVAAGMVTVRGYAIAYGRGVARVDVSADNGASWMQATFDDETAPEAWRRWSCTLNLLPGEHSVVVRAIDDAGQSEPNDPATVWNFAGYLSTAWHRVGVTAR